MLSNSMKGLKSGFECFVEPCKPGDTAAYAADEQNLKIALENYDCCKRKEQKHSW